MELHGGLASIGLLRFKFRGKALFLSVAVMPLAGDHRHGSFAHSSGDCGVAAASRVRCLPQPKGRGTRSRTQDRPCHWRGAGMNNPAVELDRVSKSFVDFQAVREISLEIPQGEFFSLLGPSGCGKTTTLRMIAGFEHPTSGEIRLMGEPVQHLPLNWRNVNKVLHNYALFPHLSVFDNVAFSLQVRRRSAEETRERVVAALRMARLPGLERRKPNQLSGGQ